MGDRSVSRPGPRERVLPWLGTVARLVLGGVLLVAGVLKLGHTAASVQAVQAYRLLPPALADGAGVVLPILEVALGALLVLGLFVRWSAVAGGLLMVVFSAGIASAWARGLSIDCGCFGGGGAVTPGSASYLPDLARDAVLALLALYLVVRPSTRLALDPAPPPDGTVPDALDGLGLDDLDLDDPLPAKETRR